MKVTDSSGKVLLDNTHPNGDPVVSRPVADNVTDILKGVISQGTGNPNANLGRPAAGKTGTTEGFHDAWFVGYTPTLSTAVWMGNSDSETKSLVDIDGVGQVFGGTIPAQAWHDFMVQALQGVPVTDFSQPPPLVAPPTTQPQGVSQGSQQTPAQTGQGGPYLFEPPTPSAQEPTTTTTSPSSLGHHDDHPAAPQHDHDDRAAARRGLPRRGSGQGLGTSRRAETRPRAVEDLVAGGLDGHPEVDPVRGEAERVVRARGDAHDVTLAVDQRTSLERGAHGGVGLDHVGRCVGDGAGRDRPAGRPQAGDGVDPVTDLERRVAGREVHRLDVVPVDRQESEVLGRLPGPQRRRGVGVALAHVDRGSRLVRRGLDRGVGGDHQGLAVAGRDGERRADRGLTVGVHGVHEPHRRLGLLEQVGDGRALGLHALDGAEGALDGRLGVGLIGLDGAHGGLEALVEAVDERAHPLLGLVEAVLVVGVEDRAAQRCTHRGGHDERDHAPNGLGQQPLAPRHGLRRVG